MKKSSHLALIFLILLPLTACSQLSQLEINLITTDLQHMGVTARIPDGWESTERGIYYRGTFPQDLAGLFTDYFPGLSANQALQGLQSVIFQPLGLAVPTEPINEITAAGYLWQHYQLNIQNPAFGDFVFDLALTETDTGTVLIAISSPLEEHNLLYEDAFLPILESLEPFDLDQRTKITKDDLFAPTYPDPSPVHNTYFTPIGNHTPAPHTFEGRLTVPEFPAQISLPSDSGYPSGWAVFPGFTADFFTYKDYLVPVQQEILPPNGSNSAFKIILSPGKIWSEPNDNGFSRAAFPFLLVFSNTSDAYNGLATFLFNDHQVSAFRFQVTQETASTPFELWGQSPMDYRLTSVPNLSELQANFESELSAMLPVQPWQILESQYPTELLDPFISTAFPLHNSATGILMDGTIYLQPCQTRYGPFPYCQYMRHGSFSLSKSLGAATAMLWLAQKYGPEVFELRIADYVDIDAEHNGWEQVTFGDALNQATGIGDASPTQVWPNPILADEDGDDPKFIRFMNASTTGGKITVCASFGNYPWGPGEVVRYNSCNTFFLSLAMDNYLKSVEGPQADLWTILNAEVFRPVGISALPIQRTTQPDGSQGIPVLAWGLYPTYQDAMKIAQLLLNNGQHHGQQLLHPGLTAEMLHITPETGLPSGEFNTYGEGRYFMSLWAVPFRSTDGTLHQIPYMSGWGGNRVIFTPNGLVAFRFTDSHDYDPLPLILTAEAIQAFGAP